MYKLYSMQRSGNSYKVRLALALLNAPYRAIEIDILRGESRTPNWSWHSSVCLGAGSFPPAVMIGVREAVQCAVIWVTCQNNLRSAFVTTVIRFRTLAKSTWDTGVNPDSTARRMGKDWQLKSFHPQATSRRTSAISGYIFSKGDGLPIAYPWA
jgi:hypothetical protein